MKYVVKLSPEITIKSKAVRKQAMKLLVKNIKIHFDRFDGFFEIHSYWDRIDIDFVSLPDMNEEIQKILGQIPGISHFMAVEAFAFPDLGNNNVIFDCILEKAQDFYGDKIGWKTFAVRVSRSWNHDFRSIDLEKYIWGWLLQSIKESKVQLKDPDVTVKIEVKDRMFYIVKERIQWIGWYPVWFQDRVLSLISGWFDSGVATFLMMKRWCLVDYLFFNLWWSAHELGVKQVAYYLWSTFSVSYKRARFITVDFEEVIKELLVRVHHKFRGVVLKRYMLRVASMLARDHYYALVKGDSLGQVSSQTLKNMYVIDKASSALVLRPLISHNKQEIVDVSRDIWTYDFACNMPEYCGVISDKPSTWAKLEKVLEEEVNIKDDILVRAFEHRKTEFVSSIIDKYFHSSWDNLEKELEVVSEVWGNDVIVDIREDREKKKFPLNVDTKVDIVDIPFFEINHRFKDLDQSKNYLFYCGKWVLSNLYWLYLKEKLFNDIKVFREKRV
jgi:tRNA uracil 4-sulfurtransferase